MQEKNVGEKKKYFPQAKEAKEQHLGFQRGPPP
jgi:hypothetical protein